MKIAETAGVEITPQDPRYVVTPEKELLKELPEEGFFPGAYTGSYAVLCAQLLDLRELLRYVSSTVTDHNLPSTHRLSRINETLDIWRRAFDDASSSAALTGEASKAEDAKAESSSENSERLADKKALEDSITHWTANLHAQHPDDVTVGASHCALCQRFQQDTHCGRCPVARAVGANFCRNTPYSDCMQALTAWRETPHSREAKDWFQQTAYAEIRFLKQRRNSV